MHLYRFRTLTLIVIDNVYIGRGYRAGVFQVVVFGHVVISRHTVVLMHIFHVRTELVSLWRRRFSHDLPFDYVRSVWPVCFAHAHFLVFVTLRQQFRRYHMMPNDVSGLGHKRRHGYGVQRRRFGV